MITNTLKKCCENCPFIEGYVDTEINENCLGDRKAVSTIYCGHKQVCKPYIEETEKESIVNS